MSPENSSEGEQLHPLESQVPNNVMLPTAVQNPFWEIEQQNWMRFSMPEIDQFPDKSLPTIWHEVTTK
jgi:hypothetical protein